MSGLGTAHTGWRYGLLGLPLAFVSLPLYITLPRHYAEQYGLPLTTLGALLLLTRLIDAGADPGIGRWVDKLFGPHARQAWRAALLAALFMSVGFSALWWPPQQLRLLWLSGALVLTYLSYSVLSMVHQAWAARWGGHAGFRARLIAWREAASLLGLLLASILPAWLGMQATSATLAACLLVGVWSLKQTAALHHAVPSPSCADASSQVSPWRNPAFRALLLVFLLNGTAAAIPATLLPFFVRDTLAAPQWEPAYLLGYFLAAAAGLPCWVKLSERMGMARTWMASMALSILAFVPVPLLSLGDAAPFMLICLVTGFALGADLAMPGAMLTGLIHEAGHGRQAEGRYLGWWTCATKLNLALASGIALPALGLMDYEMGHKTGAFVPGNQLILGAAYAALPCALKLVSLTLLWSSARRHPSLQGDH